MKKSPKLAVKMYPTMNGETVWVEYKIIFSFLIWSIGSTTRIRFMDGTIEHLTPSINLISHSGIGWFPVEYI